MKSSSATPAPPNIILMVIDDLGARDVGCYGSTFYETPRLDRLAKEGMHFTNAYASCPVCSPTRASLLTGKYPATLGLTDWIGARSEGRLATVPYLDHLPLTEKTIATALRQSGYHTWHIGKWHLGDKDTWPEQHGFEINIGGCGWGHPRQGHFAPWGLPNLSEGAPGEYLADRLTTEAIRLLETPHARPFFMNLWHYSVHTPIQAPADLVEKYRRKARALGLDQLPTFAEGEPMPALHLRGQRVRRRLLQSDPIYAAMIENLDTNIGRLLDALEQSSQAANTLVLITSDNGGLATAEGSPTCNAPLAEGKGWMYEGGNRVVFLARWPGVIQAGSQCHAPITSPDVYPTLLEVAGETLDEAGQANLDGRSLGPLLRGQSDDQRCIFWHYPHYANQGGTPSGAVRRGNWKLLEFFETGRLELYDLAHDISEKHNVAAAHPALVHDLHDLLGRWRRKTDARMPQINPNYERPRSTEVDGPEV